MPLATVSGRGQGFGCDPELNLSLPGEEKFAPLPELPQAELCCLPNPSVEVLAPGTSGDCIWKGVIKLK